MDASATSEAVASAPKGISVTAVTSRLILCAMVFTVGCSQRQLMKTPNLYADGGRSPFGDVPAVYQNNHVDVLYATDRKSVVEKGKLRYNHERSKSLAFGACRVTIGDGVSWETLVRESLTQKRRTSLPIKVGYVEEWGRFPGTPMPLTRVDGRLVDDPISVEELHQAQASFRLQIIQELQQTPRKEVFLFVHGFANDFDVAAITIAQIWHFIGRQGVPMIYTWPAGIGGLTGYFHDRESGEFTIYHLKQFLRTLASVPELEKIHILAHSRGTDVVTTALRELHIEIRASGGDTGKTLKLGNLILAAPDLDAEVTSQRIGSERLFFVPERFTVYVSRTDKAIGFADWLMHSIRRIGQLVTTDLTATQKRVASMLSDLHVVNANIRPSLVGHGYFHSNPAVSSDLILILRDNRDPGVEHGRPLINKTTNFWELNDNYPEY